MTKDEAWTLWYRILRYADSVGEFQGEGNSGEFYDEKEAQRIANELHDNAESLRKTFAALTGWTPILQPPNIKNYHEEWKAERWIIE